MVTGDNLMEKRKYPGALKIKLSGSYHDLKTPEKAVEAGTFQFESGDDWVESPPGSANPVRIGRPEPADFVIKRLLSQALGFLPALERPEREVETEIPVNLLVDMRLTAADSAGEQGDIHTAVEYASELLRRQFGYSLKICDRSYFASEAVPLTGTKLVFRTLVETEPTGNDTMTLAVFKPDSAEQFYLTDRTLHVGLSDMSRQILMIADLEAPNRATREWKAFLNGQLLLHEIGHLLGAVHVSDINSVMTPRATWVSPGQFDSLNADIIRAGRAAGVPSMRVAEYVGFIAEAIKSNGYNLCDYPQVFFSHINLNREQFQDRSFGDDGVGKAIPYAERGYRRYLMRDYETARNLFYMALACDSTQGAVHYYLSEVTSGKLAELHLRKSSEVGFYRAIHEIAIGDRD
jgi:hypothetical protein